MDAVDGARGNRLLNHLFCVAALREDASSAVIVLHQKRADSDRRTVRASDTGPTLTH